MLGRKVIYVRCINCSYNNVAKGICLLDKKKAFLFIQEQFHASKSFIPLKYMINCSLNSLEKKHFVGNHLQNRYHLSPMNFTCLISRTSLFPILGLLSVVFFFFLNFNYTFFNRTVENRAV